MPEEIPMTSPELSRPLIDPLLLAREAVAELTTIANSNGQFDNERISKLQNELSSLMLEAGVPHQHLYLVRNFPELD